jgi:hypothetical protein
VNPYPTRFPEVKDLKRFWSAPDTCDTQVPSWLTVLSPKSLPIEPLPASHHLQKWLWNDLISELKTFALSAETIIAIGKPSLFALQVLNTLPDCKSVYDAMDDYPQFYRGLSKMAFARREALLVSKVDAMLVSSTSLFEKWQKTHSNIQKVCNGLASEVFENLPVVEKGKSIILGYLGTLAEWFDWDWVIALAQQNPSAVVRLIGPVYGDMPSNLPTNIEILPACDHQQAINAMQQFSVGLIPFKQNALTASVDPIKFYEYRALGLPVVSTLFGEMALHQHQAGVFVSNSVDDIASTIQSALTFTDNAQRAQEFVLANSWAARFNLLTVF